MPLEQAWIEAHIPHRGSMCLLTRVLEWDAQGVVCLCDTHRRAQHPLRAHERLGIAAGIELCAQAIAVHGALTRPAGAATPRGGVLAALKSVRFEVARLDDIADELRCAARRVAAAGASALYEFTLHAAERRLLSGRALVVLDVQPGSATLTREVAS